MTERGHGPAAVVLSLAGALALTLMPLPAVAEHLRPEWVALAVIYWSLTLPQRMGLATAWLMGLLMDVAQAGLLGQQALTMVVVAYLALRLRQRIVGHDGWQQAVMVAGLIALARLLMLWVDAIAGQAVLTWGHWAPIASSTLVWLLGTFLLGNPQRHPGTSL